MPVEGVVETLDGGALVREGGQVCTAGSTRRFATDLVVVADGDRFGHGYDHVRVNVNGHDLLRLSRDCGAHFPAEGGCSRQNFSQEIHE